jgi:hypothetical protein
MGTIDEIFKCIAPYLIPPFSVQYVNTSLCSMKYEERHPDIRPVQIFR